MASVQRRPTKLRKPRPSVSCPPLSFVPTDPPMFHNFPIDWSSCSSPTSSKLAKHKSLSSSSSSSYSFFSRSSKWKRRTASDTHTPPLDWTSEDGHSPSSSESVHTPCTSEQGHQGLYIPALYTSPFTLTSSPSPTLSHSNLFTSISTCSLSTRPRLSRRDAQSVIVQSKSQSSINFRRRWTLSISIADERVSDETLVQELERIRSVDGTPCALSVSGVCSDADTDDGLEDVSACSSSLSSSHWPWTSARVALLTVRELVRTERHYLSSLRLLVTPGATAATPPPLMVRYARAILIVSEQLLSGFEADTTVSGVSTVFCRVMEASGAISEEGEGILSGHSYVAWSGAVGEWFTGKAPSRRRRLSKVVRSHTISGTWATDNNKKPSMAVKRPVSLMEVPKVRPAVREICILPTQRIMRYVLLFRELMTHTPSDSPTHLMVSRALQVATRLAERCDRAQTNAKFLLPSG